MLLFLAVIVLAIAVVYPFITPILSSVILAYIFYPVYKWFVKKTKKKNASAMIVSVLIVLLFIIPMGFMLSQLGREANVGYVLVKQKLASSGIYENKCEEGAFCGVLNYVKKYTSQQEIKIYIEDSLRKVSEWIADTTFSLVFKIPTLVLNVLLTFFFTFFLLRDGDKVVDVAEKALPWERKFKGVIVKQIREVVHSVIYGFFILALIEGILAGLTFYFFGVNSPIIWGLVVAFLTFVPFVGAAVVWVPAMVLKLVNGSVGAAFGILVGGLVIAYIDTFVKPRVIGGKAKVHPAVILLGLLGGLKLMGLAGIILGPIILSLFIMFVGILAKKK